MIMAKERAFLLTLVFVFGWLFLVPAPSLAAWDEADGIALFAQLPSEAVRKDAFTQLLLAIEQKKEEMDSSQKKLSSNLLALTDPDYLPTDTSKSELLAEMAEQGQISRSPIMNGLTITAKTGVYVYIKLNAGADIAQLQPYLLSVENYDEEEGLAAAWVDIEKLAEVASLAIVGSMREVLPPVVNAGSAMSEGDTIHNAGQVRSILNTSGEGVKIGVISDGVDHIADAMASGDLPSSVTVLGNDYGGDEGIAMLEIIYDLAPDAQLYFHDCGTNMAAFNQAIDDLVAAGCDIICDDIGWLLAPFFEDGVIARHVKTISDQGNVLFVSSAGNAGARHYQGAYYDDGNHIHDFSGGESSNGNLYVEIPNDASVTVVLQWDEPIGDVSGDYDLYLLNYANGEILDCSEMNNIMVGEPIEAFSYTNSTGAALTTEIVVSDYAETGSDTLEVYIYTADGAWVYSNNLVAEDSIFGHAAVSGVLACGAVRATTPDTIEYFSSQGPVTMRTETRNKPDVCGVDGVSVTGAGGFSNPFYGTSAAAPHVAAVAALVESRFPSMSTAQIRQILLDSNVDLGASGFDSVYGYGRLDALAAVSTYRYVSFDSQGGSTVTSQLIANNTSSTAPDEPTWTGHTFAGWYQEDACTTPWDFDSDMVTADVTLYAKWTEIFTVTFNSKGGSTVAAQTVISGEEATQPPDPSRIGYIFTGWYSDEELQYPYDFHTVVESSITLYGGWSKIEFSDVADGAWFAESILFVVGQNLFNGVGNGCFAPNDSMTRAMFVTVLYRYAGEPSVEGSANAFTDVDDHTWYANGVIWAAGEEITKGSGNNMFCPDAPITREEIVTMLYRYLEKNDIVLPAVNAEIVFADVGKIATWAKDGVKAMQMAGILNGKPNAVFAPKDDATRAEVAAIFYRLVVAMEV